jgi:hypothetical protein
MGDAGDGHLYFVISTPTLFAQVAIANFTTPHDPCDWTCVIERGEHPWVRHKTIVAYNRARLVDVDEFERRVRNGIYVPYREVLSAQLLERIQAGAIESTHTIAKVKDAVKATLGGDSD